MGWSLVRPLLDSARAVHAFYWPGLQHSGFMQDAPASVSESLVPTTDTRRPAASLSRERNHSVCTRSNSETIPVQPSPYETGAHSNHYSPRNAGRSNFALCSRDSGGPMKFPAWSSFMRPSTLAVAATLAAFASDASAQGTRDYTGPLPPTNFRPLPSGTTPPTPNWQGYSTGYYRVIPQLRQIYSAPRTRSR